MKRVISAILAAVLALSLLPVFQIDAKADSTDLETVIAQQIKAYAKSIDQKDAVDAAAMALATHGVFSRNKLSLDETNSLTAVLMNAQMSIAALTNGCMETIRVMGQMGMDTAFSFCNLNYSDDNYRYYWKIYPDDKKESAETLRYPGLQYPQNAQDGYDAALAWMSASTAINVYLSRSSISEEIMVYDVRVVFYDRFDFASGSASVSKEVLALLGSALFREFDWEATVQFQLEVPYECSHATGNYHFLYDSENGAMDSRADEVFTLNPAAVEHYTGVNGEESTYYRLQTPVILRHDKPWVMEITVKAPKWITLSSTSVYSNKNWKLIFRGNNHLHFEKRSRIDGEWWARCYGFTFSNLFLYTKQYHYTVRMENRIGPDGSNVIWTSVYNEDLQKMVMESRPMVDAYWLVDGVFTQMETSDTELSGEDFRINYIGTGSYGFGAEFFEMKVWETGTEDVEDTFDDRIVSATCAEEGYTAHTCALCGYTNRTDFTEKLEHTYAETVIAPTCTAKGYTVYKCTGCGESYQADIVEKLPHNVGEYVPNNDATCAHDGTKTGKCAVCGYLDIVPDVGTQLPHDWSDATCTKPQICKSCGITEGNPLGHAVWYANGKEPTCTEVGWAAYEKCSRCKYSTFQQIPALGHNFVNNRCANCGLWDGPVQLGDVNGDGEIDTTDAYFIVMYYNEMLDLTEEQLLAADVNGDGEVDTTDAYYIVMFYNEMIDSFPAED